MTHAELRAHRAKVKADVRATLISLRDQLRGEPPAPPVTTATSPTPPGPGWPAWLLMILWVLLMCASMVWFAVREAHGAPAPVAKPVAPIEKRIVGTWDVEWYGDTGAADLSRDGVWSCYQIRYYSAEPRYFHGSWSISGSTLTIRQRLISPICEEGEEEQVYEVALDESEPGEAITGKFHYGSPMSFRLSRDP